MFAIRNFSMHAQQAWEASRTTVDQTAGFIGNGVDQIIHKIDVKFGEAEIGQKLEKVWSWVQNGRILADDQTHQKVRKAAFALFISLPALFFIKDIIKTTSADQMKNIDSLGDCVSTLIKMAFYTSIVLTALDLVLSMIPKEQVPTPTEDSVIN